MHVVKILLDFIASTALLSKIVVKVLVERPRFCSIDLRSLFLGAKSGSFDERVHDNFPEKGCGCNKVQKNFHDMHAERVVRAKTTKLKCHQQPPGIIIRIPTSKGACAETHRDLNCS